MLLLLGQRQQEPCGPPDARHQAQLDEAGADARVVQVRRRSHLLPQPCPQRRHRTPQHHFVCAAGGRNRWPESAGITPSHRKPPPPPPPFPLSPDLPLQVRELKRERAQLLRGGDAAAKSGAVAGALHARNEGDMSLQDMFTGLQRSAPPPSPLLHRIAHAAPCRLKERIGGAKDGAKALGE